LLLETVGLLVAVETGGLGEVELRLLLLETRLLLLLRWAKGAGKA